MPVPLTVIPTNFEGFKVVITTFVKDIISVVVVAVVFDAWLRITTEPAARRRKTASVIIILLEACNNKSLLQIDQKCLHSGNKFSKPN